MASVFKFIWFFSLALLVASINGRKDPGGYWQSDEPILEAIEDLVHVEAVHLSKEKSDCGIKTEAIKSDHQDSATTKKKHFVEDFESRPNVPVYHGDGKLKTEDKSFTKELEPRPNVSAYNDDVGLKQEKPFDQDFEPRPNVSAYNDDVGLKQEKPFDKDFEPRPNVSAYNDDVGLKQEKPFDKDFEPRPNVSIYQD